MAYSQTRALCHLRSTLEAFAVAQWCDYAGVFAHLTTYVDSMRQAAQQADYEAFHRSDLAFHRCLIDAAEVPALRESWELVSAQLDPWLQDIKRTYWPNLMSLHQEHVLLLGALRSPLHHVREDALHQHIEAGWHRVALSNGFPLDGLDPATKADAFLSTHFASRFDMEFVARSVSFVSLSHLNRVFRKRFGMSLYMRLRQIRMSHAAELLLSSSEEMASVARRVGYRNLSHFTRDFRLIIGQTPARFRRERQQDARG